MELLGTLFVFGLLALAAIAAAVVVIRILIVVVSAVVGVVVTGAIFYFAFQLITALLPYAS